MAPRAQIVPRDMVQKKPPHGSPCNNCGLCCHSSKCDIGRALFGASDGPCPALRFDTERNSFCNVVANPQLYTKHDTEKARAAAKLLLYAGMGCTMRINGEYNNEFVLRLHSFDAHHEDELDAAVELWGMHPRLKLPF
jgi:hypothetical protein